jgi:signal transduction histidine kinase
VPQPTSRTSIIVAVSILAVVAIALVIFVWSVFRAKERREAPRVKSVIYVVDDIRSTVDNQRTRWFVECKDAASPDDVGRERHVWISAAQREIVRRGDPCPLGEGIKPNR